MPEGPSSLSGPPTTYLPLPLQLRLWLCGRPASWHRCLGASVSPQPKAVRQEPPPRPSFPVDQLTELLFMPNSVLCPEGLEPTKGEAKVGPTHPGVQEGLWPPATEPGPKSCPATSSGSLPQYQVRHTRRWARGDQQFREPRGREPARGPRSFHHRLPIPRIGPLSSGRQGRAGGGVGPPRPAPLPGSARETEGPAGRATPRQREARCPQPRAGGHNHPLAPSESLL